MSYDMGNQNNIDLTRKREKTYVFFSLLFCVLAIPVFMSISEQSLEMDPGNHWMIVVMFIAFPFSIFLEVLVGWIIGETSRSFFVKHPSETSSCEIRQDIKSIVGELMHRINGEGFRIDNLEGEDADSVTEMYYSKKKKGHVSKWEDHSFSGVIKIEPTPYGCRVTNTLTLLDTLVVETGERQRLQATCNHLMLQTSESNYFDIPFMVHYCLALSYIGILVGFINKFVPTVPLGLMGAACLLGLLTSPFGIFFIVRNRKHHIGFRLVFFSICLSLVPFVGVIKGLIQR